MSKSTRKTNGAIDIMRQHLETMKDGKGQAILDTIEECLDYERAVDDPDAEGTPNVRRVTIHPDERYIDCENPLLSR